VKTPRDVSCGEREDFDLRIYLDGCCLNRLTDDQSQTRVREEAEAVERILRLVQAGRATWVSSRVLEIEIGRNPDPERRDDVLALLGFVKEVIVPQFKDKARAEAIEQLGFGEFDAFHLACAEHAGADVFLTTDDDLLRRARRHAQALRVRVENPVSWYQEFES
jgi:predicted nucleic acid-binding protein